jgi:Tol biopolymer transport system component
MNGVLAYLEPRPARTELRWLDRSGKPLGSLGIASGALTLRISPDGSRVAADELDSRTGNRTIWILDATGRRSRLTFAGSDWMPIWSPDGRQIVFRSHRDGQPNLYRKSADGSGIDEVLLTSSEEKGPEDWSANGQYIAYHVTSDAGNVDLYALPLIGDRRPIPIATTPGNEGGARFSPDGRWIAYTSYETGREEVYVQPFPPTGAKWQVSSEGGGRPRWRGDGRELFYLARDLKIVAVEVKSAAAFEVGAGRALFQVEGAGLGAGTSKYDVARDGQRFLVNAGFDRPAGDAILVMLNWTALLPR